MNRIINYKPFTFFNVKCVLANYFSILLVACKVDVIYTITKYSHFPADFKFENENLN